jgi:hypothetical protein
MWNWKGYWRKQVWCSVTAHSSTLVLGNTKLSVCTDTPSGANTGNYISNVQLNSDDNCNRSVRFASYWGWGITLWVKAVTLTARHIHVPALSDTWPAAGSGADSISTPAERLCNLQLRTHSCLNKTLKHLNCNTITTVTFCSPRHKLNCNTPNWISSEQTLSTSWQTLNKYYVN